jgi:nucleoside triphosphate diphosphatase
MTPSKDIQRLIEIMAALRTPKTGCPWDLEQNFATIAPYTIEEAYEVADAIERGDLADLKDELGDLLLQVVYHSRMAEEQGAFSFGDVVEGSTAKMIRRHPHVFGDETARTAGAVNGLWDRIKAEEKQKKNGADRASLLDEIPVGLPGLTRAIKLQSKAAKVGFDWPSLAPVFDKMREELAELEEVVMPATSGRLPAGESDAAVQEEFGDLLFVMANVARHLEIDPEAALRAANQKFTRRFHHIETRLAEQGSSPAQSDLAEMDALWDEAKATERG